MSEIRVHAFGEWVCEIHLQKQAAEPDGETRYAACAFVHEGRDLKRPIRDDDGVTVQTSASSRSGALTKMVEYLAYRFGAFNAQTKAIDLRRRVVDSPPMAAADGVH